VVSCHWKTHPPIIFTQTWHREVAGEGKYCGLFLFSAGGEVVGGNHVQNPLTTNSTHKDEAKIKQSHIQHI